MSDLELMIEDNKAKPYLVSEEEGHQNEIDNLLFFDAINSAEKLGKSKSYIEELREKGMYLASKIYAETTKILKKRYGNNPCPIFQPSLTNALINSITKITNILPMGIHYPNEYSSLLLNGITYSLHEINEKKLSNKKIANLSEEKIKAITRNILYNNRHDFYKEQGKEKTYPEIIFDLRDKKVSPTFLKNMGLKYIKSSHVSQWDFPIKYCGLNLNDLENEAIRYYGTSLHLIQRNGELLKKLVGNKKFYQTLSKFDYLFQI